MTTLDAAPAGDRCPDCGETEDHRVMALDNGEVWLSCQSCLTEWRRGVPKDEDGAP